MENGARHKHAKSLFSGPIFQPQRTLKVIVTGAGASGLLLAYKLQRHFGDLELTVLEKNPEVSGTWYENVSVTENTLL
jgi:cation diffusion facilitator CzcD-associated flavoprotein CzcO